MTYSTQSPVELIAEVRRVLSEAQKLGVPVAGRFADYVAILEAFSRLAFPRTEPWGPNAAVTWEASSQCQQLVTSNAIWPLVNQEALKGALRRIMKGDPLPPEDTGDDQPRNTLLELTTAALLHSRHFEVELTVGREDVVATAPGLPPFSIECKRPASSKSLIRNLQDAKDQLQTRYDSGGHHGIAVLGVDRVLGLTESGLVARSTEEIARVVHELGQLRNEILRVVTDPATPQLALSPRTPLFGLVLVGSVFNLEDGVPVSIQQLALSCSGPEDHEVSKKILSIVAPLFDQRRV